MDSMSPMPKRIGVPRSAVWFASGGTVSRHITSNDWSWRSVPPNAERDWNGTCGVAAMPKRVTRRVPKPPMAGTL